MTWFADKYDIFGQVDKIIYVIPKKVDFIYKDVILVT